MDKKCLVLSDVIVKKDVLLTDGLVFDKNFVSKVVDFAFLMNRSEAEVDARFKQIIPYILVFDKVKTERKILIYRRTSQHTDNRLSSKWSVGIGGHINQADLEVSKQAKFNVMNFAALREFKEELGNCNVTFSQIKREESFVSISTSEDEVSSVHVGPIFVAVVDKDEVRPKEEIAEIYWLTKTQLENWRKEQQKIELWSRIVIDEVLLNPAWNSLWEE